ncbi:MAG: TVP38/TMEM64 family protein [Gammaproteobacteria bacterium]
MAAILAALHYFGMEQHIARLLGWVQSLGPWGPILYILIDMLVVVFLVPGVVVTMGAGFLFGVVSGTVYVVIATTTGAATAFMIARYFAGEKASEYLRAHAKLDLIADGFAADGWRIVLITRLIPFFPFKLSNYVFGLTRFSFYDFVAGTFIGIWPITLINVYLGSIAGNLATLGSSEAPKSPLGWTFYGGGFVVVILASIYLSHRARNALRKYVPNDTLSGNSRS